MAKLKMSIIPADTTPQAYKKQIEILRRMSPEQRALISFELSDNVRQNAIAGIKKQHPDFTNNQTRKELLRRIVGNELLRKIMAAKGLR